MAGCLLRIVGANVTVPSKLRAEKTRYGLVADVSTNSEFQAQLVEAEHFLVSHEADLQALSGDRCVQKLELDFGVWNKAPEMYSQSHAFPATLVARAAECGIGLTVSMYLAESDSQPTLQADGPASGGPAA